MFLVGKDGSSTVVFIFGRPSRAHSWGVLGAYDSQRGALSIGD